MFDWREQMDAFEDVSAYSEFSNELTAFQDGEPLLITGTQVVGNFFTTLGVSPMMGRTFRMEETWDGQDDGIVISHALWVNYFGSDPDVIGKRIEFAIGDGEVLGVMPRGFRFPSEQIQFWGTYGWDSGASGETWFRRAHFVRAFMRLAPGVSHAEADA